MWCFKKGSFVVQSQTGVSHRPHVRSVLIDLKNLLCTLLSSKMKFAVLFLQRCRSTTQALLCRLISVSEMWRNSSLLTSMLISKKWPTVFEFCFSACKKWVSAMILKSVNKQKNSLHEVVLLVCSWKCQKCSFLWVK